MSLVHRKLSRRVSRSASTHRSGGQLLITCIVHVHAKYIRYDSRSGRSYCNVFKPCRGNTSWILSTARCLSYLPVFQPSDLVKQSIPFSYLSLTAASNDGKSHSVQIYTDISAEWVSGDVNLPVNWTTTNTGGIITHQVQLQNQAPFTEFNDSSQCTCSDVL